MLNSLHTVLILNKSTTCHVIFVRLSGCLITGNQLFLKLNVSYWTPTIHAFAVSYSKPMETDFFKHGELEIGP